MHSIKRLTIFLSLLFIVSSTAIANATASFEQAAIFLKNINLDIENKSPIPIKAIVYKDHLYLPVTRLFESMDHTILWNASTSSLCIKNEKPILNFAETDPSKKEHFIYGKILDIHPSSHMISIDQHLDDNSIVVHPHLKVSNSIMILSQRKDKRTLLDFNDLQVGDVVGLILNNKNIIQRIILNY